MQEMFLFQQDYYHSSLIFPDPKIPRFSPGNPLCACVFLEHGNGCLIILLCFSGFVWLGMGPSKMKSVIFPSSHFSFDWTSLSVPCTVLCTKEVLNKFSGLEATSSCAKGSWVNAYQKCTIEESHSVQAWPGWPLGLSVSRIPRFHPCLPAWSSSEDGWAPWNHCQNRPLPTTQ